MAARRTPKQKIIEAALKLAEKENWSDISLPEIAKAAKVSLGQIREEFDDKPAILKAFMAQIDQAVLDKAAEDLVEESARDRLFDILMLRLEILEPYKAALKNILPQIKRDPGLMLELSGAVCRSAKWMLIAADLEAGGAEGFARERGLALVFAKTLDVWLEDDETGLAKTMAELDRQLRRGESWLENLRVPFGFLSAAAGVGNVIMSCRPTRKSSGAEEEAMPQA